MARSKYQEVANELRGDTGETPSCIHMFQAGKSKVKMYEGGYIEISVAGSEKSGTVTIDKDGNNTPGYYVTEEDDRKTIHPLP